MIWVIWGLVCAVVQDCVIGVVMMFQVGAAVRRRPRQTVVCYRETRQLCVGRHLDAEKHLDSLSPVTEEGKLCIWASET